MTVFLTFPAGNVDIQPALLRLAEALAQVDHFFGSLGGLLWYHLRCLRFIDEASTAEPQTAAGNEPSRSWANGAEAPHNTDCHLPLRHDSAADGNSPGSDTSSNTVASNSRHAAHSFPLNARHGMNGLKSSSGGPGHCNGVTNSINGSSIGSAPVAAPATAVGTAAVDTHSQQQWHMPAGIDLQHDPEAARRAAAKGIQSLPYMAEIYPIGGETGSTLP